VVQLSYRQGFLGVLGNTGVGLLFIDRAGFMTSDTNLSGACLLMLSLQDQAGKTVEPRALAVWRAPGEEVVDALNKQAQVGWFGELLMAPPHFPLVSRLYG
jgi:hypothetical protein